VVKVGPHDPQTHGFTESGAEAAENLQSLLAGKSRATWIRLATDYLITHGFTEGGAGALKVPSYPLNLHTVIKTMIMPVDVAATAALFRAVNRYVCHWKPFS
jgi:hypothetical protein